MFDLSDWSQLLKFTREANEEQLLDPGGEMIQISKDHAQTSKMYVYPYQPNLQWGMWPTTYVVGTNVFPYACVRACATESVAVVILDAFSIQAARSLLSFPDVWNTIDTDS